METNNEFSSQQRNKLATVRPKYHSSSKTNEQLTQTILLYFRMKNVVCERSFQEYLSHYFGSVWFCRCRRKLKHRQWCQTPSDDNSPVEQKIVSYNK